MAAHGRSVRTAVGGLPAGPPLLTRTHRPPLATRAVAYDSTPLQLVKGVPRYDAVPAVRLARLANHEDYQGRGLGERLLATAVRDVLAAAEHVGIVLMTVDAPDEAAATFYERYGFVRLEAARTRPALAARIKDLQTTFSP